MKKAQVAIGLLFLSGSLILGGSGLAATQPSIDRNVIGSTGQEVTAPGNLYRLNGTLGEPIAGSFVQGTSYGLSSGFWANSNPGGSNHIYLPLIIK